MRQAGSAASPRPAGGGFPVGRGDGREAIHLGRLGGLDSSLLPLLRGSRSRPAGLAGRASASGWSPTAQVSTATSSTRAARSGSGSSATACVRCSRSIRCRCCYCCRPVGRGRVRPAGGGRREWLAGRQAARPGGGLYRAARPRSGAGARCRQTRRLSTAEFATHLTASLDSDYLPVDADSWFGAAQPPTGPCPPRACRSVAADASGLDLLFLIPDETGGRETYARELISAMFELEPRFRRPRSSTATPLDRSSASSGSIMRVVRIPVSARRPEQWALGELALLPSRRGAREDRHSALPGELRASLEPLSPGDHVARSSIPSRARAADDRTARRHGGSAADGRPTC